MKRDVRAHFSPLLLIISGNCLQLGVNGPIWEVGFEPFPENHFDFRKRCPQNLFPGMMTGM